MIGERYDPSKILVIRNGVDLGPCEPGAGIGAAAGEFGMSPAPCGRRGVASEPAERARAVSRGRGHRGGAISRRALSRRRRDQPGRSRVPGPSDDPGRAARHAAIAWYSPACEPMRRNCSPSLTVLGDAVAQRRPLQRAPRIDGRGRCPWSPRVSAARPKPSKTASTACWCRRRRERTRELDLSCAGAPAAGGPVGHAARQSATARFSTEQMVRATERLYESLLERRATS